MFEKLSKLLFSFLTAVSLCATSYASAIQASETLHTNELIVTQKQTQSDSPLLLNTEIIANENPQEASLSADNAFLSARKAFKNKNIKALNKWAMQTISHPLYGYVQLWQNLLQLKNNADDIVSIQAIEGLIAKNENTYLAERARGELARIAANTDNKALFYSIWPLLMWQNTEPDLKCHKAYMDLSFSPLEKSLALAKGELLNTSTPSSEACKRLGNKVLTIDPKWIWHYVTILTQQRRFNHAKRLLSATNKTHLQFAPSMAIDMFNSPEAWYNKNIKQTKKLPVRLLVLAILRLASIDEDKAAKLALQVSQRLNKQLKTLVWGHIGFHAALNHNSKALQYYGNAPLLLNAHPLAINHLTKLQWNIRTALRLHAWSRVLTLINRLPPTVAKDPCWVYWKARSLNALHKTNEAKLLLKTISKDVSFYGLLACDYLKLPYPDGLNRLPSPLTEDIIKSFDTNPHIRRAIAFYDLNLIYEGNREWNWSMRKMGADARIQLSAYALNKNIFHRAINTSISSGKFVPNLSYPFAYEKSIRKLAQQTDLPAAWIFGLIRQESRFIASARSSAGALGLMQVMPKTAYWTAKNYDITSYKKSLLIEPETNLLIGTHYLKTVSENFDGSIVLSTASYNAGPSRAQLWRSTLLHATEGAIFAETIPFNETREYVKQVTANMTHYFQKDASKRRLSDILDTIIPQPISPSRIP